MIFLLEINYPSHKNYLFFYFLLSVVLFILFSHFQFLNTIIILITDLLIHNILLKIILLLQILSFFFLDISNIYYKLLLHSYLNYFFKRFYITLMSLSIFMSKIIISSIKKKEAYNKYY
jgi:hypothetical protein